MMGEMNSIFAKRFEANKINSDLQTRRINRSGSKASSVNRILYLQKTIGNQAVQRLIKSGALQAKLRIGQTGDVYEQEADRVADEVMRMPEPQVQRQADLEEEEEEILQTKLLVDQITPLVQRQVEEEEEEEMLQAKSREDATSEVSYGLESQINAIKGGGRPLGESERGFFEPRFGSDFSQVRVHTDTKAAEAARAVNARAFTVGQDIAFGAGQYAPDTAAGRQLLTHELTHVLQQGNATAQRELTTSKTNNFLERGANEVTLEITTGASHVQRDCTTAAGGVIFMLYSHGIDSGCTYLRPGARVEFLNDDTVTHTILETAGLFTSSSFLMNPGAKVIVWVSRVSRETGGTIRDNRGGRETMHDVVFCP